MSPRNTIHYIETRGSLGQGVARLRRTVYYDDGKSQLLPNPSYQQFHYKALSNYYVDKMHRMLTLWAGPFLAQWSYCEQRW